MREFEEILRRRTIRTQCKLLGQWWCVPLDYTPEETEALLTYLRDDLGPNFAACPLEYIKDRLFGGFTCGNDDEHRHVYFAIANYSFIAAQEGRYWEATRSDRSDTYCSLLESNANCYLGDGPFTEDAPMREEKR